MRTLYFDCFSGASGDMIVGALIDAGVPIEEVRRALGSLAIGPETVWTERVRRAGISATKFCVLGEDPSPSEHEHRDETAHAHAHAQPHGVQPGVVQPHDDHARRSAAAPDRHARTAHAHSAPHRTLAEITALIDRSALSPEGRERARHLFDRLGRAEAAIHGTPVEQVHLHEVGALDSIIDIVGAVCALEYLGAAQIVSSPLNVGGGTVHAAHGAYPVPAPATLHLLRGAPMYAGPQQAELVTPTGALVVTDYAARFGPLPAMRIERTGYGAGSRDFPDRPNVLRVVIGESDDPALVHTVVVIECEIDDMNPQIFGVLMDRLLDDGALDVFFTPIQMKKGRPGTLVTIVAAPAARERLTSIVFSETTTIGVRYRESARECLERETVTVATPLGAVRVKVARRDGRIMNASPEFDDCVRLATEHGRPVKDVQALALKLFLDR